MAIAFSIAFTPSPLGATEQIIIEATNQVSAGKSFMPRSAYKQVFVGTAASATPANILSAWNAIYGALIAGQRVFVRAWVINANGIASKPIYANKVIT